MCTGGYYLTSAYGAMSLLRHFREEQAAEVLSSQTRNTLHQWHRRRTDTLRAAPSINDFQVGATQSPPVSEEPTAETNLLSLLRSQNYLRVALQELDSGCTAKTLKVAPYATAEEVCQLCAQKFKVSQPENYGLFLVTEDSSQQLAPDTHPQKIKAELHSSAQVDHFHFVYRRLSVGGVPTNLNQLAESLDLEQNLALDTSLILEQSLGLDLTETLGPGLRLSLPPAHLDSTLLSV